MELKYFNEADFEKWERHFRANFFNSIGGFKSLNLIGTKSETGVSNLGLFFSVSHIGANPPLVGVIFRPEGEVPRHTLENIRATKFFTVNSVRQRFYEKAHQASAKFEAGVSEFEALGFRESYSQKFSAPYVEGTRIAMGLQFVEEQLIKANQTILVIGKVVETWVDGDALLEDGFIDHSAVDNVAVNGLDTYYSAKMLKRLEYARPDETP